MTPVNQIASFRVRSRRLRVGVGFGISPWVGFSERVYCYERAYARRRISAVIKPL